MCSFNVAPQSPSDFMIYKHWTIAYNRQCGTTWNACADFYYCITKSRYKLYNPQDGKYYYYYYLFVQSNSTYSNKNWAYTKLDNVKFYLNGYLVHTEQYVLFREEKLICTFWHPTNPSSNIHFTWSNISVY